MPTMSVDVVILAQEVQRRRQTLLVGTLGILVLGVGTLAGPFVGSMMVSITMSGSPFFGGPLVETESFFRVSYLSVQVLVTRL